jgi:hypothetical protein
MAEITAALVKDLREKTGVGMMDCKKALAETEGNLEAAVDWLRAELLALPPRGGVRVVDGRTQPDTAALAPATDAALRQFVAGGGRLVLFGHAARLVGALGVEPEAPEATVFRWGYDARAVAGRADLGFETVAGALADVYEDLGGQVIYPGKPYAPIYQLAIARLSELKSSCCAELHACTRKFTRCSRRSTSGTPRAASRPRAGRSRPCCSSTVRSPSRTY